MTLEQYANYFEIIGGTIVVVTLVFLVIQLRQNTRALRSTTLLGNHNTTLTVYQMLTEDSMIEVLHKGMPRPADLGPKEKAKFNAFWTVALQNFQQSYYQIRAGTYDESLYDGWWQVLRNNFLSPGFGVYWKQNKFILSSEFQNFVEEEVMRRQPTPNYADTLAAREEG